MIKQESQGNFNGLFHVLGDIPPSPLSGWRATALQEMPEGLRGYYLIHDRRMSEDESAAPRPF